MVSVHPNPPPGQGFTHFNSYYVGGEPTNTPGMKRSENNSFLQTSSSWNACPGVEDPSKKVRKPYTITKSRESWSEQEHDKFLEALHLFDRDWKKIEAFVGSKTVIQIRSHAQKYFLKVQKNGISEHVPPPRPKRKAAYPYPQKAPKYVASQPSGPLSSAIILEPRCAARPESMSIPKNKIGCAPLYPWTYNGVPTGCESHISKDDFRPSAVTMMHNCRSSSNEIAPRIWTSDKTNHQGKEKLCKEKRVIPDFAQAYSFIGSVFDPSASNHLQRLKKMDPINVETISLSRRACFRLSYSLEMKMGSSVLECKIEFLEIFQEIMSIFLPASLRQCSGLLVLMLMKNLSVNLVSPEFENHRRLLSSYNVDIENDSMGCKNSA